jgi:hypothetical protein
MRKVHRVGMIALLAIGAAVGTTLAGSVTVGRFYLDLAKAKNLAAADAGAAETSLRQAGFELPKLALDKGLTEGDLNAISNTLGLAVRTDRPSAPVSDVQLSTFMTSFGKQIAAPKIGDPGANHPTDLPPQAGKGKGKKKGHHKSSSEPI